jgi:hypothetical protein
MILHIAYEVGKLRKGEFQNLGVLIVILNRNVRLWIKHYFKGGAFV